MKKYFIHLFLFLGTLSVHAQVGDQLFDDTFIHTIEIHSVENHTYEEFHELLKESAFENIEKEKKPYYPAIIIIDGTLLDTIGVRYKGVSSLRSADLIDKWPIKIDINEYVSGQEYDNLKKFNLNNNAFDVSMMRAKLSMELMNRTGIIAPRVSYAKIYLNDSFRGLYSIVEQIDKTFVRDRIPSDTTGYLHKALNMSLSIGSYYKYDQDLSEIVEVPDTVAEYYHKIIGPLKTKKSSNNYQPIIDLAIANTNTTDEEFENDVNGNFDISSFIRLQAINVFLEDRDHYCDHNKNFYIYRNPTNNKWLMIPWDYDLSFGVFSTNNISNPANPNLFTFENCFLNERFMRIPNLRLQYRQELCDLINHGLDSSWINDRINTIANLIATEVENDPFFWEIDNYNQVLDDNYVISYANRNWSIPSIRNFVKQRTEEVKQSLLEVGFNCENNMIDAQFESLSIDIRPNPTTDMIVLRNQGTTEISSISIVNTMGQEVKKLTNLNLSNWSKITIDLSNLSSGLYYILSEGKNKPDYLVNKLVKL